MLVPSQERELTTVNDYGTATHITTKLGSKTQDLGLSVKLANFSGKEWPGMIRGRPGF